jgi:phosphate butyryltransferase
MKNIRNFSEIIKRAQEEGPFTVSVASAEDVTVLSALEKAHTLGISHSIVVGNKKEIINLCDKNNIDCGLFEFINELSKSKCASIATRIVKDQEAHCLMKGLVSTADFMKAVLSKENGLSTGRLLSHVALLESPLLDRIILSTDGAINIYPTLEDKAQLIFNLIEVTRILGLKYPRIAVLAAIENVYEKMVSTSDAAKLTDMGNKGVFNEAIIDGPLGFDNAISKRAAEHKKVNSKVAGLADGLVCPDLESAIMVVKAAVYLGGVKNAGVVIGAIAPIVLTSRSDLLETKLVSLATARLLMQDY